MEALARSRAGHKQNLVAAAKKEVPDMDDDHEFLGVSGDDKNKRSGGGGKKGSSTNTGGSASSMRCCQAERCNVDLSDAKQYHKRHKVCEHHAKAQVVIVAGLRQRFCQQCSRFHEVSEFDETKRSCRRRLAGHNERRRKSSNSSDNNNNSDAAESRKATSSSSQVACGQVGDRGRIQISIKDNPTFEHFQIR